MQSLLTGTSVAALVAAAAWSPASAACAITVTGGTTGTVSNPSGSTVNCISVNSATVNGNVANAGTITPGSALGILIGFSTINGTVTNSGSIMALGNAILAHDTIITAGITNSGSATGGIDGIGLFNLAAAMTFSGGIHNTGTINAGVVGIDVNAPAIALTFSGGISNGGDISAAGVGILVFGVPTFLDGITNTGTISVNAGIGISVVATGTFTGGIVSSGTINATGVGVQAANVPMFAGGITVGNLTAGATGVRVADVSAFSGGITSTGALAAAKDGISVDGASVQTFTGDIVNQGTITVAPGFAGIRVGAGGVITFNGNISNAGTISGSGNSVFVGSGTINGGIVNTGKIASGAASGVIIHAQSFGTTAFGVVNDGSITARSGGVTIDSTSRFLGGITNTGTISAAAGAAIFVGNTLVSTFLGGITNTGTIAGVTGIRVLNVTNTFGGHIVNSGNITASSTLHGAIDVAFAPNAVTIDQQGGTIAGEIRLSPHGDTLNITGGAINGDVLGPGTSGTVNFSLGSGTFTYGSLFVMNGLGAASFNSGTTFIDGSLHATAINVDSGATVGGSGTLAGAVVVASGGTLMPGHALGTLTLPGSVTFNSGSFYSIHVTPSASTATNVTVGPGNATINGGTVLVTLNQLGAYNHTYTILTAANAVTGTFAGATVSGGFFGTATLSYDPHDVFLTLAGATLLTVPSGASLNQQNVINGINNAIVGGSGSLSTAFQNLGNLSGSALLGALTELSGENNAGFFQGAFQAGNGFLGLMVNPFLDGRFGSGSGFGAAMGFAAEEPPALPQAAAAFASAMPVKAAPAPASFAQRFSVWGAAYGGSGRVAGDAAVGTHDTSASAAAVAAGIDYRLSPDTIVGFALAGGGTSWDLTAGVGGGHSDMFQAGVYGSHHWGAAYLSGAVAYNFHDVTTNRTVTIAGTDMLQARFRANGVGARLEGGYRYATPWLGITPYAAAQVQSIALPNYGETATAGSNQFALNFASQTATTTRSELGAWLDRSTRMDSGALLTLYGRAAWAHDLGNSPSASAIFQALPGSNFIVNGATPARDGALVTGAAQYSLASGWSFLAKFDGEFSSTTSIYSGSGMVKKTW